MSGTRIGPGVRVDGDIAGSDDLLVLGHVQGRVEVAGSVRVHGELDGDVEAGERVELGAESRVSGNIRARRILIADGARFTGSVDMHD